VAEDLGIDVQRDKMWPKSPLWLSRRLKEVIPLLTAMGLNVEVPDRRKKGTMVILTKVSPSGPNGGSKGGSNNEGGSKNGDTATATATEDPAQVSQPNPQAPNGGSSGSKFGCSYKPKPQDKNEAKRATLLWITPKEGSKIPPSQKLPKILPLLPPGRITPSGRALTEDTRRCVSRAVLRSGKRQPRRAGLSSTSPPRRA
jgi:hypothetical protein